MLNLNLRFTCRIHCVAQSLVLTFFTFLFWAFVQLDHRIISTATWHESNNWTAPQTEQEQTKTDASNACIKYIIKCTLNDIIIQLLNKILHIKLIIIDVALAPFFIVVYIYKCHWAVCGKVENARNLMMLCQHNILIIYYLLIIGSSQARWQSTHWNCEGASRCKNRKFELLTHYECVCECCNWIICMRSAMDHSVRKL